MKKLFEDICMKESRLRISDKYKKCLSCDCYFGLLYYMKEGLLKDRDSFSKENFEDILSVFENRKEIKMHPCLGCEPCPPAEWTEELIRRYKLNSQS